VAGNFHYLTKKNFMKQSILMVLLAVLIGSCGDAGNSSATNGSDSVTNSASSTATDTMSMGGNDATTAYPSGDSNRSQGNVDSVGTGSTSGANDSLTGHSKRGTKGTGKDTSAAGTQP
jgi:hypothetical protein